MYKFIILILKCNKNFGYFGNGCDVLGYVVKKWYDWSWFCKYEIDKLVVWIFFW